MSARNGQCAIEVVNAGSGDGKPAPDDGGTGPFGGSRGSDEERAAGIALTGDPVPATAEHGRGLTIINAVVDNLRLTGDERRGTTVRFEKALDWLPGAPGRHLFHADGGS